MHLFPPFAALLCLFQSSFSLQIEHLSFPPPTPNDSVTYAILDCEYSLDERDKASGVLGSFILRNSVPTIENGSGLEWPE